MKEAACKTDLGPLIRKLLEQQQEIEHLRAELQNAYDLTKTITAERDEARRSLCRVESACRTVTVEEWSRNNADGITKWIPVEPEQVAAERGWSCFQKDGK